MSEAILGHLSLKIFKSDTSQSRYINFTKNPVHIDPQQSTEILASKHICIRLILCLVYLLRPTLFCSFPYLGTLRVFEPLIPSEDL